ncbi:MAG: hypothetical protein ACREPA_09360 [Candidatus Dormibacteraceae bacterium]
MTDPPRADLLDRMFTNGMYIFCVLAALGLAILGAVTIIWQHDAGPGLIALAGSVALAGGYLLERTGEGTFFV